ncbi:uncharacterized protein [Diadema antillarum]|uniref:uncharacterized protein n=1 Tax=Diadema antillarum TaxID=105358 RepID=UPI003A8B9D48
MDITKEIICLVVCCLLLGMNPASSQILMSPEIVNGTVGGEVRLNCTVYVDSEYKDIPHEAVKWFRGIGHQELGSGANPRISLTPHFIRYLDNKIEIVSELIIENLMPEDATNYTCCRTGFSSCSNLLLRIQHQAYVNVLPVSGEEAY